MIGTPRNPASPDLRSVNETLNKEWQLFKQSLVREQQERDARKQRSFRRRIFKKNAEQKNPHWRVDSKAGQPLGIEDIIASVDDARSYWESKPRLAHGKAQNGFHTFCKTVDAHSNLMKCLPEQSQYLSVFCGVTTTLIKVRTILCWDLKLASSLHGVELEQWLAYRNDLKRMSFVKLHLRCVPWVPKASSRDKDLSSERTQQLWNRICTTFAASCWQFTWYIDSAL